MNESSAISGLMSTGDIQLDNLLQEVDIAIQDVRDFTLPNDMVMDAVNGASDFFGMLHPAIIDSGATGVWTLDPMTYGDDVVGFARQQMMEMGIYGQDALNLVMTHECGHRALQAMQLDSWTEELGCDYLAGIRAGLQHQEIGIFENSLANTFGSETHPSGSLRVDFIEYGKHVAEQMQENGVQPTFENCMEAFNQHLADESNVIAQAREQIGLLNVDSPELSNSHQVAFTGKYTDAEINKLRENVSKYEYEVSNLKQKVHHWENCYGLSHSSGDLSKLNSAKSELNNALSNLKDAKSKLSYAT
ncbi:MAG: hypothetical protein LBH32_02745 [Dysgonamonadaceae bacterium]|nr:hypothetical protein [Dysgonamonadaceae bacterium]